MLVCHGCHRHVRVEEPACPFCGTTIATITASGTASCTAPSSARLGSLALTAGLGLLACSTDGESESNSMTTSANSESMTTMGDGDGDPNEFSEEAAADYGGPNEFGDGDGDPDEGEGIPCDDYGPTPALVGLNAVSVDAGSLLQGSCGGIGPEAIYSFVAEVDGEHTFAVIDANFEASLYVVGAVCEPLDEYACVTVPDVITLPMTIGDVVHVVVDSSGAAGTASLEITTM
jgi:hypothetical protein